MKKRPITPQCTPVYILDVVPYIVSPRQTKYEAVETCGGQSKAPGRGLAALAFVEGGMQPPPPRSTRPCRTRKNGRVEGALDRADEEDGKTRGSESTRGLHKEKSTVRMEKLVY